MSLMRMPREITCGLVLAACSDPESSPQPSAAHAFVWPDIANPHSAGALTDAEPNALHRVFVCYLLADRRRQLLAASPNDRR